MILEYVDLFTVCHQVRGGEHGRVSPDLPRVLSPLLSTGRAFQKPRAFNLVRYAARGSAGLARETPQTPGDQE